MNGLRCWVFVSVAGCACRVTPLNDPCVHDVIGPLGGTSRVAEGVLQVPPSAFEEPTAIAWCHESSDDVMPSDRWHLEPTDLRVHVPLQVELPHRAQAPFMRWRPGGEPDRRVLLAERREQRMAGAIWGGGEVWVDDDASAVEPFVADHRALDVLFVVDNSCCALEEQYWLLDGFPTFLDAIEDAQLDYRIGVTSTDMDGTYGPNGTQGGLRWVKGHTIITPDTAAPDEVFSSLAGMGTSGSGSERGLPAAYAAIEGTKANAKANEGFYRDEANLAVVVVTDEPNQSREGEPTTGEFRQWMQRLKLGGRASLYGMVNQTGGEYVHVAEATGGLEFRVLDYDVYGTFRSLGEHVVDPVAMTLPLGVPLEAVEVWWAPQGVQPVQLVDPDVVLHPSGLLYVAHPDASLEDIYVVVPHGGR